MTTTDGVICSSSGVFSNHITKAFKDKMYLSKKRIEPWVTLLFQNQILKPVFLQHKRIKVSLYTKSLYGPLALVFFFSINVETFLTSKRLVTDWDRNHVGMLGLAGLTIGASARHHFLATLWHERQMEDRKWSSTAEAVWKQALVMPMFRIIHGCSSHSNQETTKSFHWVPIECHEDEKYKKLTEKCWKVILCFFLIKNLY